MKIKKIFVMLIVIISLILLSTKVQAIELDTSYKEKEKVITNTVNNWLETFKSEDTLEEKRITDYRLESYSVSGEEAGEEKIESTIRFSVTPCSENTTWKKINKLFLKMSKVDGEYQVDFLSETPPNYDKFLEKFKEYKESHPEELKKTEQVQGQKAENNLTENTEVQKMSNIILVSCWGVLAIVICIVGVKFAKVEKSKNLRKKTRK